MFNECLVRKMKNGVWLLSKGAFGLLNYEGVFVTWVLDPSNTIMKKVQYETRFL